MIANQNFWESIILVFLTVGGIIVAILGLNNLKRDEQVKNRLCDYCNAKSVRTINVCEKHEPKKNY